MRTPFHSVFRGDTGASVSLSEASLSKATYQYPLPRAGTLKVLSRDTQNNCSVHRDMSAGFVRWSPLSKTKTFVSRHVRRVSLSTDAATTTPQAESASHAHEAQAESEELMDLPDFVPTPPSKPALDCIEQRQLGHRVACDGVSRNMCKHGYPQAFVFHPSRKAFNSGLFRLSCPLLVRAVDEYEDAGGLLEFNYKLEKSKEMQAEFRRVNARHRKIRREMVRPEDLTSYITGMGREKVEQILDSGIAGVSPEKQDDVKCLHANLADYLCTGDNMIGKEVLEVLQRRRQVDVTGIAECWQQCDSSFEPTETSWWYTPKKNKQKLRSRHRRRHLMKAEARQQREEADEMEEGY